MTKQDLQKELQEKVKEGVKPSDLKKLKRSKSADDLTTIAQPVSNQSFQQLQEKLTATQEKLTNLQTSLGNQDPALLRKAREDLITLRKRLQELFPDQDEAKPSELLELVIDKNNELRLQALKDFGKLRDLGKELVKAAEELVTSDQQNINLQVQNKQLLREKKDLETRLQSANERMQNLYKLKGLPHNLAEKTTNFDWWTDYYFLLTLILLYWLSLWLLSKNTPQNNH